VDETFQSADEVRFLLEQIRNAMPPGLHDQIRTVAIEGPEKKRREYPPSAYLDQIERNAIYLFEGVKAVSAAIVRYLMYGEPILNMDQINPFVTHTSIVGPQQTTLLHVNYLRYGCTGCAVHQEHERYAEYRTLRQAGDLTKYYRSDGVLVRILPGL
jgi:hypothetical protein